MFVASWIEVSASALERRFALADLVDVDRVHTGGQAFQVGGEEHAVRGLFQRVEATRM
jgi:hypothetical protein